MRDDQLELVVRGGTVVTAEGQRQADVGITGGKVVRIDDRVPGLHDKAEGSLPALQGAARAAVAGLPVLRDARRVSESRRKSLG